MYKKICKFISKTNILMKIWANGLNRHLTNMNLITKDKKALDLIWPWREVGRLLGLVVWGLEDAPLSRT